MKCVACGNENDSNNIFCVFCGKKLLQESQAVKVAERELASKEAELESKEIHLSKEAELESKEIHLGKEAEPESKEIHLGKEAELESKEIYLSKEAEIEAKNESEEHPYEETATGNHEMAVIDQGSCDIEVQNNQVEVAQSEGEAYIETNLVKKKSGFKLIAGMLILIILGVGIGTGLFYYMQPSETVSNSYEENYELDTVYGMEYTNWYDASVVNLYCQTIGKEKISIAENINRNSFTTSPESGNVAYVDGDNNLFVSTPGSTPIKVSKEVGMYTISFSEDGAYLFFGIEQSDGSQGAYYIYNIAKDTKEKLLEGSYILRYFDEDSKCFYYVDENNNLYRVKEDATKDKLAENVYNFKVLDESTYVCEINEYGQFKNVLYTENEDKIEEQELEFDYVEVSMGNLKNGKVVFFMGTENGSYEDALYMVPEGQEPIQLADSCAWYQYSEDNQIIYYIDSEDMLYSLEIPELNKKCFTDKGYLKKVVEAIKPQELMRDVTGIQVSPDGKNVLAYKDYSVYLCRDNEQVKLMSSEQQRVNIFNDYVVYLTEEGELFVQEGIDTTELSNLQKPQLIDESVESYTTSKYGKYIAYINKGENQDILMRYSKEAGKVALLEDMDTFDYVTFNGLGRERKLKYGELVGHYSCEELDSLFKFSEDGRITAYALGEEQASTLPSLSSYSINAMYVESLEPGALEIALNPYDLYETTTVLEQDTTIAMTQDGNCIIYVSGYYTYELTPISEDVFNQKFAEQQEEEKTRREEEEARQREEEERIQKEEALNIRAQNYYYEGAYILDNTYIYETSDYSSSTGYYTIGDRMWYVYDYYIDYDTSTIWVKIEYTPSNSYYANYGWIPLS